MLQIKIKIEMKFEARLILSCWQIMFNQVVVTVSTKVQASTNNGQILVLALLRPDWFSLFLSRYEDHVVQ